MTKKRNVRVLCWSKELVQITQRMLQCKNQFNGDYMTTPNKQKYYIDKKEMYNEILRSREQGKCTEELGLMFMKLAEKYSHHPNFRDYGRRYGQAFKDDLVATGLHACAKAWNKFDPEKSDNPFSFFTTCLYRAFIGYLSKEYDFSNTKNAMKVDQGLRGDYGYEEMIKEKEDAEKVEDEEELKAAIIEEADEEDLDEFGMAEEEPKTPVDVQPKKRLQYTHLDHMTLWGDEEPNKKPEPTEEQKHNRMFGVDK